MKKFLINVNGKSYEVEVEEIKDGGTVAEPRAAAPVPKPAAAPPPAPKPAAAAAPSAVPAGAATVTSPMPGTILAVNVKVGEAVKKGQVLCILEAMKMENEIMAAGDAVVASIEVNAGDAVNTGQVLIVLK
ncbi:MAG TPA: biotin/lipoyl-binding protein [Bacillota bacterium]|nr:biotin/lipoyl-binding protein [Bacillota bacterium]HQJ37603.1 biotin/lipoyl-binding protein [Bacillota bacterium]